MLTKTQLKEVWEKYDFRPLKRLGQNFLIDKNIKDKILKNLELSKDDIVIEIGAGFGELTLDLAKIVDKVFAIEKDKKIVEILKKEFEFPPTVFFYEKDFLEIDIKNMARDKKVIVYGNLPYYVTTPIMEKLFNNISLIDTIYLVMQKEVADRILATPGLRNIGRLSLYVQYYTEPKKIFNIGRDAFYPKPGVESIFLKLRVRKKKKVEVKDETKLFQVIKMAYGQRRKTIRNSLSRLGLDKVELSDILRKAGLRPSSRAEELSLEDFAKLTNIIQT